MIRLADLFDQGVLGEAIGAGYVRVQHHPAEPLVIYNYTEAATFGRAWSPVTLSCRGLIAHSQTGYIVGRPFEKFFNHNEPESADLLRSEEPVTVTSKEDGSLAVLHPLPVAGGYAIATRGSFTSEQAIHATEVWRTRYAQEWSPPAGMTALFEIVYPANRIVLDYQGLDDLILLGFVDIDTGRTYGPNDLHHGWPGPTATVLPYTNLLDALADEPAEGTEGYVVHFLHSDRRMKIKGSWYLQLHRLVTGLTARVLWEHLAVNACLPNAGDSTEFLVRRLMMSPDRIQRVLAAGPQWEDAFRDGVPDELHQWMNDRTSEMRDAVERKHRCALAVFEVIKALAGNDRKRFAELAKAEPDAAALFSLLDGREIDTHFWREVRPAHESAFRAVMEEAA